MINLDQLAQQRRPIQQVPGGQPAAGIGGPGNPVLFQPQSGQGQPPPGAGQPSPMGMPQQRPAQAMPQPGQQPGQQHGQQRPQAPPIVEQFQQEAMKLMELNSIISEQEERLQSLRRYMGKSGGGQQEQGQSQYGKALQQKG